MGVCLPGAFEAAQPFSPKIAIAGLAVGLGTALGNGCTSGHGLCGLSSYSLRSLAAVPTFMAVAAGVATLGSGGALGSPLPIGTTPPAVLELSRSIGAALVCALVPIALLAPPKVRPPCLLGDRSPSSILFS